MTAVAPAHSPQTINVLPAPQAQFATVTTQEITCDAATTFAATNLAYTNSGLGGCLIAGQVMGSLVLDYDECGGTITQAWTFTDECGRTAHSLRLLMYYLLLRLSLPQ